MRKGRSAPSAVGAPVGGNGSARRLVVRPQHGVKRERRMRVCGAARISAATQIASMIPCSAAPAFSADGVRERQAAFKDQA